MPRVRCPTRHLRSSRPRLHESMLVFDYQTTTPPRPRLITGEPCQSVPKLLSISPHSERPPNAMRSNSGPILGNADPHLACWNGTYRGPTRWLGMTKAHKAKKPRAISTRFKASNKRKLMVRTAAKSVTTPATTTVIAQEPSKMPFVFWPLDILRWWMPTSPRGEA